MVKLTVVTDTTKPKML